MQILTKDTTSTIILTLTEMSELVAPIYLFRLISEFTSTEIAFIGTDISSYPNRYNKFSLLETANPDLLDNEYELEVTGFYLLEVYEQESTTNLDYRLSSKLLDTSTIRYETTLPALEATYVVYDPTQEGVLIPPSPTCPVGTFENSDGSYTASVSSGGTTVGPDITVTDSDGSTFTSVSNVNVTCTPSSNDINLKGVFDADVEDMPQLTIDSDSAGTYTSITDDGSSGSITRSLNGGAYAAFSSALVLVATDTLDVKRTIFTASGFYKLTGTY